MATHAQKRTNGLSDLPQRIAVAVPAAAVAIVAVAAGGPVFAALAVLTGALAAREALPLLVRAGASRAAAAAITLAWIGIPVAAAIALREHDHGGGLVLDVMLAVFVGDTAAHLLGSTFGRRPLAPRVSPNKTVEGLVAGIAAGTGAVLVAATGFQPWLSAAEGLVLGLAISCAAPVGDLAESALKRRAGVKDSGRLLGAHGGFLDRFDAILLGLVAGYAVALLLV
jgi:phosphatidate cytidylyltransferase